MNNELSKQFFQEYGILPVRLNLTTDDEMSLSEHIEEFSQRFVFGLAIILTTTILCFSDIKEIVRLFQAPAVGIKFLQFAPGEYFFASVKIAFFCGILISSPFLIYQLFLYILPGLTQKERKVILPLVFGSGILFGIGLIFSYFFLVPAALNFFIAYGKEVVEPFWSFDQYFNFVSVLIFATGLSFQVPILQFILGFLGIVSGQRMLSSWKYVLVITTVLAAVITPSTDPITQILMASALFILYLGGVGVVLLFKK